MGMCVIAGEIINASYFKDYLKEKHQILYTGPHKLIDNISNL